MWCNHTIIAGIVLVASEMATVGGLTVVVGEKLTQALTNRDRLNK
jgi:hypothetical protein